MKPENISTVAIERIVMLCRSKSRHLLSQCNLTLELAERGIKLVIDDAGRGVVQQLNTQEHFESLVGAASAIGVGEEAAALEAISLLIPHDEPIEIGVRRFADFYSISSSAVDWSSSIEARSTFAQIARNERRCKLALSKIKPLAFLINRAYEYVEYNGRDDHLVVPWTEIQGYQVGQILPGRVGDRFAECVQKAFRYQERPQFATYALDIRGVRRHYRAKFKAYGGDTGEAIAIITELKSE